MTISLDEFMNDFSPEERAKVAARTAELIDQEMTLRDLRIAEKLTQERLSELMGVEQATISRLERRADLLISTLSAYVAAMGGKLRLVAEFPDRHPVSIALTDISDAARICARAAKRVMSNFALFSLVPALARDFALRGPTSEALAS